MKDYQIPEYFSYIKTIYFNEFSLNCVLNVPRRDQKINYISQTEQKVKTYRS